MRASYIALLIIWSLVYTVGADAKEQATVFQGVDDCKTDNLHALQEAVNQYSYVEIAPSTSCYVISGRIDLPSDVTIVGRKDKNTAKFPLLRLQDPESSNRKRNGLFFASAKQNITLKNMRLEDHGSAFSGAMIQFYNAKSIHLEFLDIIAPEKSAIIFGDVSDSFIERIHLEKGGEHGIILSGEKTTNNLIEHSQFIGQKGFAIWVTRGAHHNVIGYNEASDSGLELLGITFLAHHNYASHNTALRTGDNGFSVSGDYNELVNNTAIGNAHNGIGVYGNHNKIIQNKLFDNNQSGEDFSGIDVAPAFGGHAKGNIIMNNEISDRQEKKTQQYGVNLGRAYYQLWKPNAPLGQSFRYYGQNVYYTKSFVGNTGDIPPRHKLGARSDGSLKWEYLFSFDKPIDSGVLDAKDNMVSGNKGVGNKVALIGQESRATNQVMQ